MAKTKLSDVITPEVFTPYVLERSTELNVFIQSGIATPDNADIANALSEGGKVIHLPFWQNKRVNDEVLSDSSSLTINKIQAGADIAAIHARGLAYAANDLAKLFSGDDPMGAIADKVAKDWQGNIQDVALNSLAGAFAAATMSSNLLDISAGTGTAAVISNDALVDAMFLLGDHSQELTGLAMHSAVLAKLAKLKLLDTYPNPTDHSPFYQTYLGKTIIVDDSLAPSGGAYPIYLFGQGALAFNENTDIATTEVDRDILAGDDILTTRRVFTMHPRGIKWIGTPAGATPTNAELAVGTNWQLVAEAKNVHIAKLIAKISA